MQSKKVLIIYYSFSSQTRNIVLALGEGLKESGIDVTVEQIQPRFPLKFPIGSYRKTFKAMITTFFKQRIPIHEVAEVCRNDWDLIILGGPTWSFQPSGPVLSLLDGEVNKLFNNQRVLPVISCRSFWKKHQKELKKMFGDNVKKLYAPIVYSHPVKEPWCTIGLYLKLVGKVPESESSWMSRYYSKYGHNKNQMNEAKNRGRIIGNSLFAEKGR